MHKYIDMNGNRVNPLDPNRVIWYAVHCGYWTDDFDRLDKVSEEHPIPCCPVCKSVGYMAPAVKWNRDVFSYARKHPGYEKFVTDMKNKCMIDSGGPIEMFERMKTKINRGYIPRKPTGRKHRTMVGKIKLENKRWYMQNAKKISRLKHVTEYDKSSLAIQYSKQKNERFIERYGKSFTVVGEVNKGGLVGGVAGLTPIKPKG